MLKLSLCDYRHAYITFKGTVTVPNTGTAAVPNSINKEVVFKNCAPFSHCISEINSTEKDNVKDMQ